MPLKGSGQTPMLTLNQKLPGEQSLFKSTVQQRRVYRQGKVPTWLKTTPPPSTTDSQPQPKIIRPALKPNFLPPITKTTVKKEIINLTPEETKEIISNDLSDEYEPLEKIDLSTLKIATSPENRSNESKTDSQGATSHNRRELIKQSLLKNMKIKETAQKIISAEKISTKPDEETKAENNIESSDEEESSESLGEDDRAGAFAMQQRFQREKPKFVNSRSKEKNAPPKRENANELALRLQTVSSRKMEEEEERHRADSVQLVIDLARHKQKELDRERDEMLARLPDDTDDPESAEVEFEQWKMRELLRLQEETERKSQFEEEQAKVEERRLMSDAERELDNSRTGSKRYEKSQQKISYLQKYYHKGVFYQDNELVNEKIMERDFMQPVGEDKWIDRTALPEVMQVKNFGKGSRTKYTHLVDQDTTFGDRKTPAVMNRMNIDEEERKNPIMGDHRNPVNPWMDFRSSSLKRFRDVGGKGGFERPTRKQFKKE